MKTGFVYQLNPERKNKRKWRWLLLALILLAMLLTFFYLLSRPRQTVAERFESALERQAYEEALALYRQVQVDISNSPEADKTRLALRQEQTRMESLVQDRLQSALRLLEAGQELTLSTREACNRLAELAANTLVSFLNRQAEHYLLGELEEEIWENTLKNLKDIEIVRLQCQEFSSQSSDFNSLQARFIAAKQMEREPDFLLAWHGWLNLSQSEELNRFAKRFADQCLSDYEERVYPQLLAKARDLLMAESYYQAQVFLEELEPAFPQDTAIRSLLDSARQHLPQHLEHWRDHVTVLSLKPLVVNRSLAFKNSADPVYAESNLLSVREFQKILESLYRNKYVLVSAERLSKYPEVGVDWIVPEGKKPLILVFDDWQYHALHRSCGTAEALNMQNGRLTAHYQIDAEWASDRQGDALCLLEDFIASHPDFSFDGARGILALSYDENFLGHITNASQLEQSNLARQRQGLDKLQLDDLQMEQERAQVQELLQYFRGHNWLIAATAVSYRDLSHEDRTVLRRELEKWQGAQEDLLQESSHYIFPYGNHVYQTSGALEELLDHGYHVLWAQGPKPYNHYFENYVHLDMQALNGNSLKNSQAWNLDDLFVADEIYDRTWRE